MTEPTQAEVERERDKMRRVARFDTMTEIANQLSGALLADERVAATDQERDELKAQRQRIRRQVRYADPDDAGQVDRLIADWAAQLRAQRGDE